MYIDTRGFVRHCVAVYACRDSEFYREGKLAVMKASPCVLQNRVFGKVGLVSFMEAFPMLLQCGAGIGVLFVLVGEWFPVAYLHNAIPLVAYSRCCLMLKMSFGVRYKE